jgi:hypothetical protein
MLDSLIVQDRPPDRTNPGSAVGAIGTFDAVGGWMKSSRQLKILAVAPPSTRMSKEFESNRARCATAGPGFSQYA